MFVNNISGDFMKRITLIEKRSAACMFLMFLLFTVSVIRIMLLCEKEDYKSVAERQSSYKLTVSSQRGTIFDTNMRALTNSEKKTVTAVMPNDDGKNTASRYLDIEEMRELSAKLSAGKPVLVETEREIEGEGVKSITYSVCETKDTLAPHLIGYLDGSGHGVCGLQKAFDPLLYSDSTVAFRYVSDGKGDILFDFECDVSGDESVEASGVKITIDADIQTVVEEISLPLKSGAVVISEVGTGKIRALVSRPAFDPSDVAKYLGDETSPLLNRAFCAYNVGSVFKPCVAAAALEQGIYGAMIYECVGGKQIGDKYFACHRSVGHGLIDLKQALAFSCNTYFYTLAAKTGAEAIYSTASSLGFGQRYEFCDGLATEKGNMPTVDNFGTTEQGIANVAIGQGSLMLTPISLLTLYDAIAGGGYYRRPTLIEGIVKNGVVTKSEDNPPTEVMSAESAEYLREALCDVIKSGTGKSAKTSLCTAAGKTATAQTGWKRDGRAVDHSWLCGFFPAEEPKYVAVIISEDTSGDGTPCAPLFAQLADAIYSLKLS